MKTNSKAVLGIINIWPLIYYAAFTVIVAAFVDEGFCQSGREFTGGFLVLTVLYYATIVPAVLTTVWNIALVFRADEIPQGRKWAWAAALVLFSIIANPVFWYLHNRTRPPHDS